jgi:hypothetical protein
MSKADTRNAPQNINETKNPDHQKLKRKSELDSQHSGPGSGQVVMKKKLSFFRSITFSVGLQFKLL